MLITIDINNTIFRYIQMTFGIKDLFTLKITPQPVPSYSNIQGLAFP